MSAYLGTIRTFRTKQFTVSVDAYADEDLDLSFDDTGQTQQELDQGTLIAFRVKVCVKFRGREVGADYLGGCIYQSIDAFEDHRECGKYNHTLALQGGNGRCGSYFSDMIHEAIREARETLQQPVYIRRRSHE